MSSTVTTTTITTVTTAATFEGLSQALTIIAIALLILALVARELSATATGDVGRRVARGLDIALMPLMVTFGLVIWINSGTFLS